MDDQPKIRVVVRKRPLTRKEQNMREQDVVEVWQGNTVVVREMKYFDCYSGRRLT